MKIRIYQIILVLGLILLTIGVTSLHFVNDIPSPSHLLGIMILSFGIFAMLFSLIYRVTYPKDCVEHLRIGHPKMRIHYEIRDGKKEYIFLV